jgi:CDP-4-dehydro-6-deoxyglucose reductase
MEKRLSVIRAARLAGVRRAELQARIQRGELPAFDGTILAADLLALYPAITLEDERVLERIAEIKAAAVGRDLSVRTLPDPQILARRLSLLGEQLSRSRELNEHYEQVLQQLEGDLRHFEQHAEAGVRVAMQELRYRVQRVLHQKRRDVSALGASSDAGLWMTVLAPQVRLLPEDCEFLVEGADTVLEAALRAGLSIRYGCSNGVCGECRARIVTGEVRAVRPHDYALTEAERSQGVALLCSVAPITDLVIEMGVARTPEQIPRQSLTATLRDLEFPSPHVAVLRLQTPRTRRLRFLGGQYIHVSFLPDGPATALPLANCPCDDRNLLLHVAEDRESPFAQFCFTALRKGQSVQVEGPFGAFVKPIQPGGPLIFLCQETGFAPVKSMIEHLLAVDDTESLSLVWVASGAVGHYADNLCRSWEDAIDRFHYRPVRVATHDPATWSTALVSALTRLPDVAGSFFYLAGSTAFLQTAQEVLERAGITSRQFLQQTIPPLHLE